MGSNIARCVILLGILSIFLIEQIAGKKEFNQPCKKDEECKTGVCEKKVCRCPNFKAKLVQFFSERDKKCVSAVGKACTLPTVNDGLPPYECVENAECGPQSHLNARLSPEKFGICRCKGGYEESDSICLLPEEKSSAEKREEEITNYKINENESKNLQASVFGNSGSNLHFSHFTALLLIFCITYNSLSDSIFI